VVVEKHFGAAMDSGATARPMESTGLNTHINGQVTNNLGSEAVVMEDHSIGTRRKLSLEDDGEDYTPRPSNKRHNVGTPTTVGQANSEEQVEDRVILIKFLNNNKYTNPTEACEYLNNSAFQKYIIQYSVRILGNGNGVRLGIRDLSKKLPPLENITTLNDGKIPVRCWEAGKGTNLVQGKISPIDVNMTNEYILENIETLGGYDLKVMKVARLRDRRGNPTMTVILDFVGSLPKNVAVSSVSYPVDVFKRPPLRCYKCFLFGHGSLTCKFIKSRCQRCCGIHEAGSDSPTCSNPLFCLFCGGSHRYSDRSCPVNIKAENIDKKREEGTLADKDVRQAYKELNANRVNIGVTHRNVDICDESGHIFWLLNFFFEFIISSKVCIHNKDDTFSYQMNPNN